MTVDAARWRELIRDVPDFPSPGIVFKDLTPLLGDALGFASAIDSLADHFAGVGVTAVAGIEARGFLFAAPVAKTMGVGLIPIRKAGKLPWEVENEAYALEYGTDLLEIHSDAMRPGDQILIVDDVLATGGTAAAACRLIERLGAEVAGLGFVIDLAFLGGRKKLDPRRVEALVVYDGESSATLITEGEG